MSSTAEQLIAYLQDAGAPAQRHAGGRSLLGHLIGTYEITRRWSQPEWLQHAALIHSVYGTEAYHRQLVAAGRRSEISQLAGERAERLAHLFAVTPRRFLFAGTYRWAPPAGATRDELDALVLLHMANLADQARAEDGSPGTWLISLRDLAGLVVDSQAVTLPLFMAQLVALSPADEAVARETYREALAAPDPTTRITSLALAAARCPVIPEPCVWLADAATHAGDQQRASEWASVARERLVRLGTPWDKRLAFDEWLTVIDRLGRRDGTDMRLATHPRQLYDALTADGTSPPPNTPPSPGAGEARFVRYMHRLTDAQPNARLLYPELERRPFWDPETFPLARELQSHFPEIKTELQALDPAGFAPESEPIARTGDWDVRFFNERGRRHDETCAACPTTARIVEGRGALLTAAGMTYVSRMRPGTHIAAHRGPTNLRLRCHLGIVVPDGDCAIRVQDEARPWQEGACLVFDDSFEHEAWNHARGERIVLIVDLWHPDLSEVEVRLLAGQQRHAARYARRLERYWELNAVARGETAGS